MGGATGLGDGLHGLRAVGRPFEHPLAAKEKGQRRIAGHAGQLGRCSQEWGGPEQVMDDDQDRLVDQEGEQHGSQVARHHAATALIAEDEIMVEDKARAYADRVATPVGQVGLDAETDVQHFDNQESNRGID